MRVKESEVRAVFERFCKAHGFRMASTWNDVGGLKLDHNSVYGGWCINKIDNDGGGISCPFGYERKQNGEFVDMMRFAIMAESEKKNR